MERFRVPSPCVKVGVGDLNLLLRPSTGKRCESAKSVPSLLLLTTLHFDHVQSAQR